MRIGCGNVARAIGCTEVDPQGRNWTSAPCQERSGHRCRWHLGEDPRYRATRKSVVSIRIEAHPQAHGVGSEETCRADWTYDAVSIGYPGPVLSGRPSAEPVNLGRGWIAFDFAQAFGRPVKVMNDAAMQALGSYKGGKMLFLGLGTGLGTALIDNGVVKAMELGHLPYKKGTYENYVGRAGLERSGKKKWRRHVADVVERLTAALRPDDTVIGGGNVKKLNALPRRCRAGENANAFRGGFRLWAGTDVLPSNLRPGRARSKQKT